MMPGNIVGGPKKPEEGEMFEGLDDAAVAEWSFRALIRSLLRSNSSSAEEHAYGRKMLEAGAEGMLRRIAAITHADERIDAFGDAEMLVKAALHIALYERESALKALATDSARQTKAENDAKRVAAQTIFLRSVLGDRPIDKPYKIAEELYGSSEAQAALDLKARQAGLEPLSLSTLRRRLNEMAQSPH